MKKRIFSLLLLALLCLCLVLPAAATETQTHPPRVVDEVGLLSNANFFALTAKLDELSERLDFDVVAVIAYDIGYQTAQEYADEFFDDNGYGMGDGGILFLIAPNNGTDGYDRSYAFSTCGKGETIFDASGLEDLKDATLDLLSGSRYAEAIDAYAETCDELVGGFGKPTVLTVVLALAVGIVLSFLIPMNVYKGQLKSVRTQAAATDYVRSGSMQLSLSRDLFLYRNITRTPKPKNTSSGNGSHTSSSGRSHGGTSGGF